MTTADDFSDADQAPEDDDTQQDTPQQDQAGAHPIREPDASTGQAAVPAPDTSAESQIGETE